MLSDDARGLAVVTGAQPPVLPDMDFARLCALYGRRYNGEELSGPEIRELQDLQEVIRDCQDFPHCLRAHEITSKPAPRIQRRRTWRAQP